MASITIWNRFEPRPRSNDLSESMAAPIRDPLWFLTRQWQLGEFQGRDAGSVAYVNHFGSQSKLPRFTIKGTTSELDPNVPLERQTLAEPVAPDLALRVELSQVFEDFLAAHVTDGATFARLRAAFFAATDFALPDVPDTEELNPVDPATKRFLSVCLERALDGYVLYQLAQQIADGSATVPDGITTAPAEKALVASALADLLSHVSQVFGTLGTSDPPAWTSRRLEYQLQVTVADPAGQGSATMNAVPNSKGEFDWYSFDATSKDTNADEEDPEPIQRTMIPSSARFPGMPSPRFWYIEENTMAYVDVEPAPTDIVKLLVTDIMLVHGNDWFLLPFEQPLGTAVQTKGLVVTDVFGHNTLVSNANRTSEGAGLHRWTMFSTTDDSQGQEKLTDYFVVPPSPGSVAQDGPTLEDVRFARDEMANIGWAIERVTESPIGEPRSGRERDAEIAQRQNFPPPTPADPAALLRYQLETTVPANWTPLVDVQPNPQDPSIELERAAMLHPTTTGVGVVPSLGRFLNPTDTQAPAPVRFFEEEVPRDGTQLVRTIARARWIDGSTHVWVSRRRLAGAGEAQSNLRFDTAPSNEP